MTVWCLCTINLVYAISFNLQATDSVHRMIVNGFNVAVSLKPLSLVQYIVY